MPVSSKGLRKARTIIKFKILLDLNIFCESKLFNIRYLMLDRQGIRFLTGIFLKLWRNRMMDTIIDIFNLCAA